MATLQFLGAPGTVTVSAYSFRWARTMMLIPIKLTVVPMMSHRVGRSFSTNQSQRSPTTM